MNILGIRVWKDRCQLVGRNQRGEWTTFGPTRSLPVHVPHDISEIGSDTLILTAYQYDSERPGSDIRDVLALNRNFDEALYDNGSNRSSPP